MSNHVKKVSTVAVRDNLIVSDSSDGLLFRYNAIAGDVIGISLPGDEWIVSSVAIRVNGKMIMFASWDKTVIRLNTDTGQAVGSPIRGNSG